MENTNSKTLSMVFISLFTCLIVVCSWISIPTVIPFTLQTFAIFCTLGILGGKRGTISIVLYILLGLTGLPVFSGFKGGFGVLFGTTGGYIIGFILSGLIFWIITSLLGKNTLSLLLAMVSGLLVCYAFGTAWFMVMYTHNTGAISLSAALSWCVLPFIIPDLIKISLVLVVLKKELHRSFFPCIW